MNFHLSRVSSNVKTGPIPVSVSSEDTCPPTCAMKKVCYAKFGPLQLHWKKVSKGERGISWLLLIEAIKSLPKSQLWRHNAAGDLPGLGEDINFEMLTDLVVANRGRKGFTYTHKYNNPNNHAAIKKANEEGFTINLSANNPKQADELKKLGIAPVATVVASTQTTNFTTEQGNKVVICPATYRDNVSCSTCGLCQRADRTCIVGFPAHGIAKKQASAIAA